MRTIISIVGRSGSGKTYLLEQLIAELKVRGYRIALVKHSHHANDLDTSEKDTWRFSRAGSALSAINSLDNLAIYRSIDHYFDPREISDFVLWDYDFILTEGFKGSNYPKIEVHRREQGEELLTPPDQLLAVVTDEPLDVDVPQFNRDDIKAIADLIEKELAHHTDDDLDLIVNGNYISTDPAFKDLLKRTLTAMIPAPRDGDGIRNMHIAFRRRA